MRSLIAITCCSLAPACDDVFGLERAPGDGATTTGGDTLNLDGGPSYLCILGGQPAALAGLNMDAGEPSQRLDKHEMWISRFISNDADLYVVSRDAETDAYGRLARSVELSSSNNDNNPMLVGAGLHIFFTSTRNGGTPHHLFEAHRSATDRPFETPSIVDTGPHDISGVGISPDGLTLYANDGVGNLFSLGRGGGAGDFGGRTELGNTGIFNPSIAWDGLTVYYDRGGMLFRMTRGSTTGSFSGESGPIATGTDPDISLDNKTLVFKTATGLAQLECL
jgi:hypothetical protein